MMKWLITLSICFIISCGTMAQEGNVAETLPFSDITETPDEYSLQTVLARTIDGLGFRYYWATDGLRDEDLSYKPSEDSRTCLETLDHVHNLCTTIRNAVMNEVNVRGVEKPTRNFIQLREESLRMLKEASDFLKQENPPMPAEISMKFKRGEITSEFPLWNLLNGPLGDALWHTGQIVSFRRASGNPYDAKVNVFRGERMK